MARDGSRRTNKVLQNGMRAWAGGAVVLLLLLTPLLNHQVTKWQESSGLPLFTTNGQRSVASVDPTWELRVSEEAAEMLKGELFRDNARSTASIGRKPSLYDRLAFGVLEGKYQFHLEDGKIKAIDLLDDDGALSARKVQNHKSFLEEFKGLFLVPYASIRERNHYLDQNRNVIVFDLLSPENVRVGQVSFIEDSHGGLQSVRLKKISRSSSKMSL